MTPADGLIRTSDYEVAEILGDTTARAFIMRHHYSGTYPAARYRFGLYRAGELVGVSVFSHPVNERALSCLPGVGLERVELGRFVLLDSVPGNGETWFLARCFEQLRREGLTGIVSFSDPIPRKDIRGSTVFPGHIGTIYQAHNAVYLGRGSRRSLRLLPDGTVFSARARQKILTQECGALYAERQLVAAGASPRGGIFPAFWLDYWVPRVTRLLSHPGNHKYAWALDRVARKHMPASLPYPKVAL